MGQFHTIYNALHSFSKSSLFFVHQLIFGESKLLLEQPKYNEPTTSLPIFRLSSLAVEILLHVFSFLELKSYIICNGVCKDWRRLLPLADIHPARRRLFALYQNMINTPHFLNSRTWILDSLQPFDRQVYIDALLAQYPAIPEEFRIWILEWPAHLFITCMWPGLPLTYSSDAGAMRRHCANWLGYKNESPQLMAVIYKHRTPHAKFIPGLLIWKDTNTTDWLIFDEDEPDLFGRVYVTDFMELESSAVIPYERQPDPQPEHLASEEEVDYEFTEETPYDRLQVVDADFEGYLNVPHADWISYLEHHWSFTVRHILYLEESPSPPDLAIPEPVGTLFDQSSLLALPTFPWNVRHSLTQYLSTH